MIFGQKCESADSSYEQGDFSNERGKILSEKKLVCVCFRAVYTKKALP